MIILSSRDTTNLLRKQLLDLRMRRNHLGNSIDSMQDMIRRDPADKEYKDLLSSQLLEQQSELDRVLEEINSKENQEDVLDPTRPERRKREKEEIRMLGFTLVDHGESQYNNRYEPQLDRTSLLKMLFDLGLASKIPNYRHHIIKLKDNFHVAVEDYKVLTFRYNDSYYKYYRGAPPKVDLRKVTQ